MQYDCSMSVYLKMVLNSFVNLAFVGLFFGMMIDSSLPEISNIEILKRNAYIKIYDRNNNLIAKYGDIQEQVLQVKQLPEHLIWALVDTEDRKFFSHHGVDFLAIIRSFKSNFISNRIVSGGSSITQQLAKNLLQHEDNVSVYDKTLIRKIKEMLLAFRLEQKYSKAEILTFYLNRIYFGCGCFGIYSASAMYFNKPPASLNIYEAAALIGLIQAPSKFAGNKELWKARTKLVLQQMLKHKHITSAQFDAYADFDFNPRKIDSDYGYFTDFVRKQIPAHLCTRDIVVKTTLDPTIHQKAMAALVKAHEDFGDQWNAEQGAIIVLSKNGGILGLVGGLKYTDSQFNRVTSAQRSVGSFFKYYIYLEAMRRGVNPDSLISDKQLELGEWVPSNYLHRSVGKVKIKDAFAQSVNSSSIILMLACGIKKTLSLVRQLGLTRYIPANPSIALGGMNASLLELTQTLLPIVNSGYKTDTYCIEEIRDAHTNELLYKHQSHFEKVLDIRTVWYTWQLLKHVTNAEGTARSVGRITQFAGGKTGTSNDYRDLVFVGLTPDYVVGTWFGRDDFQPMKFVPAKHLAVIAYRYFLESMPLPTNDIEFELNFNVNTLSVEDLLI